MTHARKLGAVALSFALALGVAACDDGEDANGEGQVEDIVEETADEADELGSPSESTMPEDDVGDEETGEG